VVTIASFDEAPEAAWRENQRQSEGGAQGSPQAFWHDGKVYLVAEQLHTSQDVAHDVAARACTRPCRAEIERCGNHP